LVREFLRLTTFDPSTHKARTRPPPVRTHPRSADPLWYKTAVIYELHVRAFADSNGDGIGDFPGLTSKLDYLQDLGITAIWLLPFYPSPLRDDGYDIADYMGVNPAYGTLKDFKRFIHEAHARSLKVITELVVNHTSDEHAWFQRARHAAPGSKERDFYVWSDTPTKYPGVRIIFKDFESSNWSWDPVAKSYYWHRFYSHQPDLNFDNPAVHEALAKVLDHWMEMGVDGMRLDAIPYLYEREGTSCENLPETHQYLKKLRAHVDQKHPGAMLLAEANQWPEDAISYFGEGDECHMAFHFPVMPRLFMAIRMEDRFPIVDILEQTPAIPENCQWAMFLRNHDELTLEMVTDEERDYMYRVYAMDRQARINLGIRRRLAPLLGNSRRKIELMNALLFSLPGTPVLYYGDEIGMGDNVYLGDRDGVRTPMQWNGDRNAGFSRASPQRLFLPVSIEPEYHYETLNVEAQQNNPGSLLWWTKRLIALRRRYEVFGTGDIRFLDAANSKVLTFVRSRGDQHVLVVANLSRFVQAADVDLSGFQGMEPVEMFGQTRFPPITDRRYFLTLGPHSFYWFSLERSAQPASTDPRARTTAPEINVHEDFERWLRTPSRRISLEQTLLKDMPRHRWFAAKARTLRGLKIIDEVPVRTSIPAGTLSAWLVIVQVDYAEAEPELYSIPLAMASQERADLLLRDKPFAVIARILGRGGEEPRVLYDAVHDPAYCEAMFDTVARKRRHRGGKGELFGTPSGHFRRLAAEMESREVVVPETEQSNSSVVFGQRFIMKLYRRIEPGLNPDLEMSRHLTETIGFPHTPLLAGALEYAPDGKSEPFTIGMLQQYVRNQGDAWQYALDLLGQYYERVLALAATEGGAGAPRPPETPLLELIRVDPPAQVLELLGEHLQWAALLGVRTAEMHAALARSEGRGGQDFDSEPFTGLSQRSLYQSMRNTGQQTLQLLRARLGALPEQVRVEARTLLDRGDEVLARLRLIKERKIDATRIRCHGDYHLGQVLWTGKDFLIIDFEGEPARSLGERRLKRSPMRDVAGMLRSLQYASFSALQQQVERGTIPGGCTREDCEPQARFWDAWMSSSFLRSYLRTARDGGGGFIPEREEDLGLLLEAFLLDKAIYEIGYELNSRPDWVQIPIRAILHLLDRHTS
jgi:maltose alpha-D-glucosyltransferase / alpha-amylase